jgi:hypothetical protein
MDPVSEFLEVVRNQGVAQKDFRGLLHVLVGRRITRADGTLVSGGMTWRELAGLLKKLRWDKESVRALGIDPKTLPPRDRQKFWYSAFSQAGLNTAAAAAEGDRLVSPLEELGFVVSSGPGTPSPQPPSSK